MPRHKRDRYFFMAGERARFDGVVHEVHSSWTDPADMRAIFATRCGMIIACKGNRRTTNKLTCLICIDGGIFNKVTRP